MKSVDETNLTEIELMPDGRIFLFGASRQILEILSDLGLDDQALRSRLHHLESLGTNESDATGRPGQTVQDDKCESQVR